MILDNFPAALSGACIVTVQVYAGLFGIPIGSSRLRRRRLWDVDQTSGVSDLTDQSRLLRKSVVKLFRNGNVAACKCVLPLGLRRGNRLQRLGRLGDGFFCSNDLDNISSINTLQFGRIGDVANGAILSRTGEVDSDIRIDAGEDSRSSTLSLEVLQCTAAAAYL